MNSDGTQPNVLTEAPCKFNEAAPVALPSGYSSLLLLLPKLDKKGLEDGGKSP